MNAAVELPSAAAIARSVGSGERSAREVLADALLRLGERNETVNAFVHVDEGLAGEAAAAVERRLAVGEELPLAGVPIGVKDMEDVAGMPTAHGSLLYRGRAAAAADSIAVARLRAAGAVPIGKTAAPEFGTDTATLSPGWGVTRNPWDPERTPGGSSGGSAAAVGAGIVALATGSDSGGSVRAPAAYCGLVGIKPTSGLIPAPGPAPSRFLSHGALVTTVADAARHLDLVSGPDPLDPFSLQRHGASFEAALGQVPRDGLRIGWSEDLGFAVVDPATNAISRLAAEALAAQCGAELIPLEIRWLNPEDVWWESAILDSWTFIEPAMWPGQRELLSPVARELLEETETLSAPAVAAQLRRRSQLVAEIAETFEQVDVLLTPTMASTAFPAGESVPTVVQGIEMPDGAEPFTAFANVAGLPAISVPAGIAADGLPVGLQIVSRRFADELVLQLAAIVERSCPWPRLAPWPPQSKESR